MYSADRKRRKPSPNDDGEHAGRSLVQNQDNGKAVAADAEVDPFNFDFNEFGAGDEVLRGEGEGAPCFTFALVAYADTERGSGQRPWWPRRVHLRQPYGAETFLIIVSVPNGWRSRRTSSRAVLEAKAASRAVSATRCSPGTSTQERATSERVRELFRQNEGFADQLL